MFLQAQCEISYIQFIQWYIQWSVTSIDRFCYTKDEDDSNMNNVSLNFKEDEKQGKSKDNKFSVRDITFIVQIYKVSPISV